MPTENAVALERAFDAFAQGDLETAASFIDPDFEIHDRVIGSPSERGTDALIANAAEVRQVFGDVSWEPLEIVDLGDRLLVRVHVTGSGDHTALTIDDDVGHIYTVRQGKAVRLDIFRTWEEARVHAGLDQR